MIKIDVDVEDKEVQKLLDSLSPQKIKKAVAEAAKRAADGAKTDGKRLIAGKYTPLKQAEIGAGISVARGEDEAAALAVFRGARLPLDLFAPRPSSIMGGKTTGGVSVLIGGARVPFHHAFNANVGGGVHVYQRQGQGADRQKLRKMTTLALAQMPLANDGAIASEIEAGIIERFEKRFWQQIERHLGK
jgi:hypothetical protein